MKVALDMSNNSTCAICMRESLAYLRHWSKLRVAEHILESKETRVRRNTWESILHPPSTPSHLTCVKRSRLDINTSISISTFL